MAQAATLTIAQAFNLAFQCWQAEKERRRERSGKPCDCGCGGVGLGANIDNIASSSSEKNPDVRINIDNETKSLPRKKPDLRRAGNNIDNAVQRKALRDTVASNAINNSNNNTDNNNLSRVPAETKGHMGTPVSSPSSGYNSSGTGGSQEDEGRQEEEERLLIDLSSPIGENVSLLGQPSSLQCYARDNRGWTTFDDDHHLAFNRVSETCPLPMLRDLPSNAAQLDIAAFAGSPSLYDSPMGSPLKGGCLTPSQLCTPQGSPLHLRPPPISSTLRPNLASQFVPQGSPMLPSRRRVAMVKQQSCHSLPSSPFLGRRDPWLPLPSNTTSLAT